jgi:ABC-type Fe3+/spermidine/putrescine transport system ATPase subunit
VHARPVNKIVADFMGLVNLISGHVVRAGEDDGIIAGGGEHPINTALPPSVVAGQRVQVAIRPESLRLVHASAADGSGLVPGEVAEVTFLGNIVDCHVGIRFDSRQSSVFS